MSERIDWLALYCETKSKFCTLAQTIFRWYEFSEDLLEQHKPFEKAHHAFLLVLDSIIMTC